VNVEISVNLPDLFTCSLPILTPSHDPAPYQPSSRICRLCNSLLSARNRSLLFLLPFQLDMIRQLPLGEGPRSLLEETRVVYARDPFVQTQSQSSHLQGMVLLYSLEFCDVGTPTPRNESGGYATGGHCDAGEGKPSTERDAGSFDYKDEWREGGREC